MAAACRGPLGPAGLQLPPASMIVGGEAAGSPPYLPCPSPPGEDARPPLGVPDSTSSDPSPLLSATKHDAFLQTADLNEAGGQLLRGSCTSLKIPSRSPLSRKLDSEDLRRCLEMPLQAACEEPPVHDGLQTTLQLLQLPIEEAHLPLSGFGVFLPEVAEECLIRALPGISRAGASASAGVSAAPEKGASKAEQGASLSPVLGVTAAGDAHGSDEAARRQLIHAAKRFQRRRRLLLQQVRNRLMAVMQQISDLQEAKEAAELFVEELRREVTALRAERQRARREGNAGQVPQQQQQQEQPHFRVYFDSRPPPSSQQLVRHQRVEEPRLATEEEVSSDAGNSSQSSEGSAHVERLMQRYYASLMAEVDQAAREHVRVAAQGGGGSRGDEGPGGFAEAPPFDAGGAAGVGFAPYYFDPFAPTQGLPELPRRGQQAQAAAAGGAPAASPATTAVAGPAAGSSNNGAPLSNQGPAAALASRSHPMLSAAAEKVRGVAFCKSNRYWICTRMDHGKQQCRYFSVKHLGFECARREAILLRQQWKGDVNEEVLKALEEEKAAMDAAAAAGGAAGAVQGVAGTAGSSSARGRQSGGDALSPSSKIAASPSPSVPSPSKGPQQVVASSEALPPPRKEKTGSVKRRRDALSRPLLVDRSGSMPRPPAEFDFGSDSDFLTGKYILEDACDEQQLQLLMPHLSLLQLLLTKMGDGEGCLAWGTEAATTASFHAGSHGVQRKITSHCAPLFSWVGMRYSLIGGCICFRVHTENEDDREEEALAMNGAFLAECAERSLHGAHAAEEEAAAQGSAEAQLRQKRREIVSTCFMGATTTADALVLLSRRLTHAVKIPGISFHKGVESWLCTWKEADSRTISRYFRCSRFGFRRGYKLSVFTLLLNAPRAAATRAFLAIKEIKRRRRAALRGEPYSPQELTTERPMACDGLESSERAQPLAFQSDTFEGPASLAVSTLASGPLPPSVDDQAVKQQGAVDAASFSVEALGYSGPQIAALGEGPPASFAATPSTNPSVNEMAGRHFQDGEVVLDAGQFPVASSNLGEDRGPSLAGEAGQLITQEGLLVSRAMAAPLEMRPQDEAGGFPPAVQFGAA
ncbi:hypothetical protein Emag_005102 [Eimeria magna]